MRNLKLILEYDGSQFFGFQRQPRHITVQEALENALSKLLNKKTKIKAASGRTDTGVHAECQVVNFETASRLNPAQIQKGLNALLPRSVSVKAVDEVDLKFHARYSARAKVYEYRIWNAPVRSPLNAGRACHIPYDLNLKKIKRGMEMIKGRHDFKGFASESGKNHQNTVRTISRFQIKKQGPLIKFQIEADGFLYHMVRNIIGTLIELGRGKMALAEIKAILAVRDRRLAGPVAPACGLTLIDVSY